jgi:hypothetical protein
MKNNRALREKLAFAREVRIVIPRPKGPRGGESDKAMNRGMWLRYHFDIDIDRRSDYEGHLFYNADLRSIMGAVEDWFGDTISMIIQPRYYACKWGDKREYDEEWGETYWKNLLDDAISAKAQGRYEQRGCQQ